MRWALDERLGALHQLHRCFDMLAAQYGTELSMATIPADDPETYDMVWDPVFTPSGDQVAAKVERGGRFAVVVDGKVWSPWYEALWEPVFSPDGTRLLIRAVEKGTYLRQVVPFDANFRG